MRSLLDEYIRVPGEVSDQRFNIPLRETSVVVVVESRIVARNLRISMALRIPARPGPLSRPGPDFQSPADQFRPLAHPDDSESYRFRKLPEIEAPPVVLHRERQDLPFRPQGNVDARCLRVAGHVCQGPLRDPGGLRLSPAPPLLRTLVA